MAKENSGQNGSKDATYFNQLREEVLNRYLGSYDNRIPIRMDTIIVEDIDCCDRAIANTHLSEILCTGSTTGAILSE